MAAPEDVSALSDGCEGGDCCRRQLNVEFWGYQERAEALSELTKRQDIQDRLKVAMVDRHIKKLALAVGEALLSEHHSCSQQQPADQFVDLTEDQD